MLSNSQCTCTHTVGLFPGKQSAYKEDKEGGNKEGEARNCAVCFVFPGMGWIKLERLILVALPTLEAVLPTTF